VEQQSSKFVIRLQLNIIVGSALFNGRRTSTLEVCYSIAMGHHRW